MGKNTETVAEYLTDLVENCHWTPQRLSRALSLPLDITENLISGKQRVTVGIAAKLANNFGGKPLDWIRKGKS